MKIKIYSVGGTIDKVYFDKILGVGYEPKLKVKTPGFSTEISSTVCKSILTY